MGGGQGLGRAGLRPESGEVEPAIRAPEQGFET